METGKIRIKKDDKVKVLTGKDKDKIGKVLKVIKKTNRVVVENINVVKVHQKPTQANPQGGIVEKNMPIHVSNLMLMCNACVKPTGLEPENWKMVNGFVSVKNAMSRSMLKIRSGESK